MKYPGQGWARQVTIPVTLWEHPGLLLLRAVFDPAVGCVTETQFLIHLALGRIVILEKFQKYIPEVHRGSCYLAEQESHFQTPIQHQPQEMGSRQERLACPGFCHGGFSALMGNMEGKEQDSFTSRDCFFSRINDCRGFCQVNPGSVSVSWL